MNVLSLFDGWYSKKLKTMACIPYLAIQQDGYSDAAGEHRTWADRFSFEEDMMKYALREFMEQDNLHPNIDRADPRQTVLREMDRTHGFFTPSLPSPAS